MSAIIWIIALVLANLVVGHFGPAASVPTAFLFIGLDLTLRDRIHDNWARSKYLWAKMLVLVGVAGIITWFISRDAGRIAVASSIALVASQLADAVVYQMAKRWPRFKRVTSSNLVSSTVDSFLFPTIAFGGFIWWATLGQILAKMFGGIIWYPLVMRRMVAVLLVLATVSANAGQVELHRDIDRDLYTMTISTFKPYEHANLFAWADIDYDNGFKTLYGEASLTSKHGLTAEYNGGVADGVWEIADVGLFGYEVKNIRLLLRTDGELQLTYYWNITHDKIQFCGFVDVYGNNGEVVILSEPQLWYRINDRLSVGGEVEVSNNFVYNTDGVQFMPTIAMRIDL